MAPVRRFVAITCAPNRPWPFFVTAPWIDPVAERKPDAG